MTAYTTPVTDNETIIALLDIKAKIEQCRKQGLLLTASTLRHQAMSLAESFVDPVWDEAPPALRSGRAMATDIDPACGF